MGKFINLTGQKFNNWTVLEYMGNGKWKCKCNCNNIGIVNAYDLKNNKSTCCNSCKISNIIDLTGKTFGEWKVLNYIIDGFWECQCSCGVKRIINGRKLRDGHSKSCGHTKSNFINMMNKKIGQWEVIKYVGNQYWACKCSCGKLSYIKGAYLRNGSTLSCGHDKFIDLKGEHINNWDVLQYENGFWKCRCKCGNIRYITSVSLRKNFSKSCGCCAPNTRKITTLERYGDYANRKDNPREPWIIETLNDKEKLINFLYSFGHKPTIFELEYSFDTSKSSILKIIHKFNLEELVNIRPSFSKYEDEIYKYIVDIYNNSIERNCKNIISPYELDIYIPEKKIAIEFNGNYWHSDLYKDKHYHQQKTIDCAKKGIQLIHIFEYEWLDANKKKKIKNLIYNILNNKDKMIYARNTVVKNIDTNTANCFNTEYHLQGCTNTAINLGCYYRDELIGVMTFGTPRFNKEYQYELHRLCWRPDINVIGGIEKLFKYFINNYNPISIITYVDISKFKGNSYLKIGFNSIYPKNITEPNYVWANDKGDVLNRYQTQKHKLIENGLGILGNTEDEIMKELRFYKIYDSGNLRLAWYKDK